MRIRLITLLFLGCTGIYVSSCVKEPATPTPPASTSTTTSTSSTTDIADINIEMEISDLAYEKDCQVGQRLRVTLQSTELANDLSYISPILTSTDAFVYKTFEVSKAGSYTLIYENKHTSDPDWKESSRSAFTVSSRQLEDDNISDKRKVFYIQDLCP